MPRDYKPEYLRELSDHKATKTKLEVLVKGNSARDAELADLRLQRDAQKFAVSAGDILTKFATAAVESVKTATKAAVKDMTTLKEGTLDGLAAATNAEVAALRQQVIDLQTALDAATRERDSVDGRLAALQAKVTPLEAKVGILERHRADLFYRLTKRLPKDWQGQSVNHLLQAGYSQTLHTVLVDVFQWLTETATSNRPEAPTLDPSLVQSPEVPPTPTDAPMTGMIR